MHRLAIAALGVLLALPAQAQVCQPRDRALTLLEREYGETEIAARALTPRGTMIEVIARPDSMTWTMIEVDEKGIACMVEIGAMWVTYPENQL